jgi:hypothetical protein
MEKTGDDGGDEMPMSLATPSNKAMMLLIYENNHNHWVDKHEKKEVVRGPKYTRQEECSMVSGVIGALHDSMSW